MTLVVNEVYQQIEISLGQSTVNSALASRFGDHASRCHCCGGCARTPDVETLSSCFFKRPQHGDM
jgi:hypothetical protein